MKKIALDMRKEALIIFVAVFCLFFGGIDFVFATNILTNGSFETGNFNGWTITNGGNGWGIWADAPSVAHNGNNLAISSYAWCTMSQEIDLVGAGYSADALDAAPVVNMSAWAAARLNNEEYSIKMELRNASHGVIASQTFTGTIPTSFVWTHFATSVSAYGSGLRYIYFEQKGKDNIFWAGQYGTMYDDAIIELGSSYNNTLNYVAGTGGTISGSSTQILNFGNDGATATATPATGYVFSSWNDGITTSARTDKSVVTSTTYTASFAANNFILNYFAGSGGTISGSSTQIVNAGSNASTVTAVPDTGYSFTSWSDGTTSIARTDLNISSNLNATATFAINTSTISYVAGTGGSISGSSTQIINYGSNASTVIAVADTGYSFTSWSDGTTSASRTDLNITTSTSYNANFALNNYNLTYSFGAGGTLSGSLAQSVSYGGSGSAVTAVPNYGYAFLSWSDGSTTNPRTDSNVTSSLSVSASFVANDTPAQPGTSAQAQANALMAQGKVLQAKQIQKQFANVVVNEPVISREKFDLAAVVAYLKATKTQNTAPENLATSVFTRDLFTNVQGDDVLRLQKYLNNRGFIIATQGPGSLGNETNSFGALTRQALSRFQQANNIFPALGYFGPKTRQFINGK